MTEAFFFPLFLSFFAGAMSLFAQTNDQVVLNVKFDKTFAEPPQVYEMKSLTDSVLLSSVDNSFNYYITKGAKVRVKIKAKNGAVNYLWFISNSKEESEISRSYNLQTYVVEKMNKNTNLRIDSRQLVPIKFTCPVEGSNGKMVQIDEQDDYGTEIKPEQDGITYMLPLKGSVYFDSAVDSEHFVMCWLLNGSMFPSKPDIFYKQTIPEGLELEVKFYKKGETRTVNFEQPLTGELRCKNRSEADIPEIQSGAKVTPGDEILFEASPKGAYQSKIDIHHWEVNGKPYMSGSSYYTDTSLSLYAVENLNVKVIPLGEQGAATIDLDEEAINFGTINIGSSISKTIKVTAFNLEKEIKVSLRDEIPSLSFSPSSLPLEGGDITITYKPKQRESVDTELIFKSGSTEVKLPIFSKSVASVCSVHADNFFFIRNNTIEWRENAFVRIFDLSGKQILQKNVCKGQSTILQMNEPYVIDINHGAIRFILKK